MRQEGEEGRAVGGGYFLPPPFPPPPPWSAPWSALWPPPFPPPFPPPPVPPALALAACASPCPAPRPLAPPRAPTVVPRLWAISPQPMFFWLRSMVISLVAMVRAALRLSFGFSVRSWLVRTWMSRSWMSASPLPRVLSAAHEGAANTTGKVSTNSPVTSQSRSLIIVWSPL